MRELGGVGGAGGRFSSIDDLSSFGCRVALTDSTC